MELVGTPSSSSNSERGFTSVFRRFYKARYRIIVRTDTKLPDFASSPAHNRTCRPLHPSMFTHAALELIAPAFAKRAQSFPAEHAERIGAREVSFGRSAKGFSSMKIAQIGPLIESVPPRFYGGTER
ncbi:MAG: hypothetical protein J0H37_10285, partial [Hyphomicrobium denitrificans]|nr:hypothetical protein [Hyphomicrobium denitrificans]